MVWGIFPGIYKNVSWESHMLGFFSGVVLSVWFRNEGPQAPVYDWMTEGDDYKKNSEEEIKQQDIPDCDTAKKE
jgi:hypothetical protein